MKKILGVIGSRKGDKSITYKFTKLLLDKIVNKCGNTQYEIITPDKYEIMPCLSCNNCFLKGNCVQDNNDSMGLIKEKILEADLIILGSPVFAHNVSGDMKTFIDRISYWLHVFRLANKKSITITTSASNGNINVNNYLSKILTMLGSQNILDIKITTMIPNLLNDTEFMKDELINYVDLICNELNDFACISTEIQETEFKSLKYYISNYDRTNSEYLYWENSGLNSCESYQEYLLKSR